MKSTIITLLALFLASAGFCGVKQTNLQKKDYLAKKTRQSHSKYELMLYCKPNCPYCLKVDRCLNSLGKTIPKKNTQLRENELELVRIGGKKTVPCLVIDGKPMYESSDIVAWLKQHKNEI